MVAWFVNGKKPPSGSWLDRWLRSRQQHPQAFTCGVRVLIGEVPGLRARWRYRNSAVDPLVVAGQVTLTFGPDLTLRLRHLAPAAGGPTRPGHVTLRAVETTTGSELELSVPAGEAITFGVEL